MPKPLAIVLLLSTTLLGGCYVTPYPVYGGAYVAPRPVVVAAPIYRPYYRHGYYRGYY